MFQPGKKVFFAFVIFEVTQPINQSGKVIGEKELG